MHILILSTWFPYPLSQGSKIRAYHLVKALARHHDVTLISFADEPVRPEWVAEMRAFCRRVEVVDRSPFARSRIRSVLGWAAAMPGALYAGYSREMEALVRRVAGEEKPDLVLALTVITGLYALKIRGVPKVLDIDNVLSRYLHELYDGERRPLRKMKAWAAWKKFARFERQAFRQFDTCLVVTAADRERVHQSLGVPLEKLVVVPNGASPSAEAAPAEPVEPASMVFNGSLAYAANLDAVRSFAGEILPIIRTRIPGACLRVTGRLSGVPLDWVPADGSVQLTGYLEDVRPHVRRSAACVVPLRLGAGTRVKILEAMALGTPVVATSKGAEGLEVEAGVHLLVADDPAAFADRVCGLLTDPALRERLAAAALARVRERYDWEQIGE
ncbi:MAG TPA: glycosyltransferase, partial [Anaerolineaceae bacterium]